MKINKNNIVPALIFVFIGWFFLLKKLNIIPEVDWWYIWPVIIIIVGIIILFQKENAIFNIENENNNNENKN